MVSETADDSLNWAIFAGTHYLCTYYYPIIRQSGCRHAHFSQESCDPTDVSI